MSGGEFLEVATLGGGCFWCLEAVFEQLRGVGAVRPGYAGGSVADPTYEAVCSGRTGHAEVVRIEFDPLEISYREILEVFFSIHDPTTSDRQGADVGPQYRSVIFHHTPEQKAVAETLLAEMEREKVWDAPIVTAVVPFEAFYPAGAYHDDYYARNRNRPYCRVVIDPKVAGFRKKFSHQLKGEAEEERAR